MTNGLRGLQRSNRPVGLPAQPVAARTQYDPDIAERGALEDKLRRTLVNGTHQVAKLLARPLAKRFQRIVVHENRIAVFCFNLRKNPPMGTGGSALALHPGLLLDHETQKLAA